MWSLLVDWFSSVNMLYMELSYTGSLDRSTRASEHVTVQISYACKDVWISLFPFDFLSLFTKLQYHEYILSTVSGLCW